MNDADAPLLTPTQLAIKLAFSSRTIRRWTTAGLLPHLGPRRRPRYRWSEVVAALRGQSWPS